MIGQSMFKMNERLHDVTQNRMLLDVGEKNQLKIGCC